MGGLLVVAVLTGVLLLNVFPYVPSSTAEWVLFVLVGIPAYLIVGALFEYAFGKLDEKVEASRRRRNVTTTGGRALLMLVVALLLIFVFALLLPLFLGP